MVVLVGNKNTTWGKSAKKNKGKNEKKKKKREKECFTLERAR